MLGTACCVQKNFAPLYSVRHLNKVIYLLLLWFIKFQGGNSELADVLCWEPALHRRMQLHEVPFGPLRRPCWEVASDWIKFQKCLKEMPSPSPTPIFRMISPIPWSVPIPWEHNRTTFKKTFVCTVKKKAKLRPFRFITNWLLSSVSYIVTLLSLHLSKFKWEHDVSKKKLDIKRDSI